MPHDDSARSEGFPKPTTSNAMARRTQNRLLQLAAELRSQEQPSIPPIVSPHPFLQFRPPLIPGFRVSEQPYKSHSVPLTVVEQPQQDPVDDLRGERVARAKRPNASTSRQAR
jgi:hypothetical protein